MELTGKCLVARPTITDPYFKKSVVYIYETTANGVAGLVLNKRSHYTTRQIADQHNIASVLDDKVYTGGPVNESSILMLHTQDFSSSNTLLLEDKMAVSSDNLMMEKYFMGNAPRRYRFFKGCAIWHTHQMKMELDQNMWLVQKLGRHEIFTLDSRNLWDKAIERSAETMMTRFFV